MDTICSECGTPFNNRSHRLVKESCGHEKCRQCLLDAENGCPQCPPEVVEYVLAEHNPDLETPPSQTTTSHTQLEAVEVIHREENINIYWGEEEHSEEPSQIEPVEAVVPADESSGEEEVRVEDILEESDHVTVIYEVIDPKAIFTQRESPDVTTKTVDRKRAAPKTKRSKPEKPETDKKVNRLGKILANRLINGSDSTTSNAGKVHSYTEDDPPLHIHKMNHSDKFQCGLCDKIIRRNQLNYHIYCDPSIPKPFVCEVCQKAYRTADHYRYHVATHEPNGALDCPSCDKTFQNKVTLATHVRQNHSGLAPAYTCDVCNKPFFAAAKYKQHMQMHTDELPFKCLHCPRRFRLKENMSKHVNITHSDARPFYCSGCDVGFKRNGAFKMHMRRIHPDGALPKAVAHCKVCGAGFSHITLLKRHEVTHQGRVIEYHCRLCKVICSRKDNLIRHVRVMHFNGDASIVPQLMEHFTLVERKNVAAEISADGEEEEVSEEIIEEVVVMDSRSRHHHRMVEEITEEVEIEEVLQPRQSSVILYARAQEAMEPQEKAKKVVRRPVVEPKLQTRSIKIQEEGDAGDFVNISSEKMEIYRKILMPSREVNDVDPDGIGKRDAEDASSKAHQRKRIKRDSTGRGTSMDC